ncbi:hypothetical protein DNK56_04230 [Streptomyces sp. AC1-42W]|nr:hypothetical protein DNK55_27335 [Streptomyces sp. AC1-42T]PZT81401.1 hypothetical protein DNK56_04230 [Streptomyces sp. AC1-42W]
MADTSVLRGRVRRFVEVTGLVLPPGGLFVARLSDEALRRLGTGAAQVGGDRRRDQAFGDEDARGAGRPRVDFAAAHSRFSRLGDTWPPAACLGLLRTPADSARPLAYYHDLERGDDLCYAFGRLVGSARNP